MADETPRRICGTQAVHQRLMATDPEYVANRARSENYSLEYARTKGMTGRTGITVIPVVVHVIHKTAAQNISDEQINSQIAVLNKDFRKQNTDIGSIPGVFAALAADARIEFKLATQDPAGNPTTGITRTSTTTTSFSDDDKMKSAATGGHDAWPRDKYLNIWVCNLGGGLLGYAQFPGGPAATDGVVITHSAFGTVGTAAAPFNLGRTTTHEIGHFLNLRHIWGDDGTGCSGSDFVGDTPNQGGPNYGTPSFPRVTCGNGPNGDLFMNYMDYVDDVAMFMFTAGQVTRMHACLDGDRSTLGTPKVLTLKFADDGVGPKLKFLDDQPTLKFNDDFTTLKFRDDPTLKFSDDGPTLKFNDDPPSIKFLDDGPSLKFSDDPPSLKFTDDGGPSLKFIDDPATLKFSDDGGTNPAIDPVKTPALDKPLLDQPKSPAADFPGGPIGGGVINPGVIGGGGIGGGGIGGGGIGGGGVGPGGRGAAPFILSTAHHSMAWAGSFPQAFQAQLQQHEQQLAQMEQLLLQYQQGEQAGVLTDADRQQADAVFAEYQRLMGEYMQMRRQV
jgi:hypothetical protein